MRNFLDASLYGHNANLEALEMDHCYVVYIY